MNSLPLNKTTPSNNTKFEALSWLTKENSEDDSAILKEKQKLDKFFLYENKTCYFISPKTTTSDESKNICKNILNSSYSYLYEYENEKEFSNLKSKIKELFRKNAGFHIGLEMINTGIKKCK